MVLLRVDGMAGEAYLYPCLISCFLPSAEQLYSIYTLIMPTFQLAQRVIAFTFSQHRNSGAGLEPV
jgi:hypothetical protein